MALKNSLRNCTLALATLLSSSALAQRTSSNAPPNDPATELKSFKIADGMEVSLFAAEPMLIKPIGITFDARGRLWVAGSPTYPQIKPGDAPNDKIFVLEDTDNDGKADKSTLFADGLLIATSVEMADDGGVYAANSTEILHLKDTDGDGKADQRKVVLSGFGTEDTHHVIHSFRWDNGGRLNFLQGIYIGSRVETPRGTKVGLASTHWQFRPETIDLQIYCQGLINPWGVTWDRYGQIFLTDGAGGEGVNFAPPGAQFTAAYEAKRVLKGLNPGSPKFSGAEIVDGRHFPDDWQGDLITNDFRANRTVRFKLTEDGSGFSSKLMPDVITSTDKAYRPVDVKMGPDGALYIADWYNPIINHGEVDFRDPRRDKQHGRIWRLTAKGRPLVKKPKFYDTDVASLLELLRSPEQYTRLQAKIRLRQYKVTDVLTPLHGFLQKAIKERSAANGSAEAEQLLLEILWTFETLDLTEGRALNAVLQSPNANVRAAGVRVAGHWASVWPDAKHIAALVTDESPRVRLEAVRALAAIGTQTGDITVVPAALAALDKPIDPVIDFALYQLLAELSDKWVPAATSNKLAFAKPEHLNYALRTVKSGDALKKIVTDLKAGTTPVSARKEAYDLIAAVGAPADLSILLDHAANAKAEMPVREAALAALERAARLRKTLPAGATPARVQKLIADPSPAIQEAGAKLAGLYKMAEAKSALEAKLADAATPPAVRLAAAQGLADFGPESIETLRKQAAADRPAVVRSAAIAALASLDQKTAAQLAGDFLVNAKSEEDPTTVLGAFLKREGGIQSLSTALKGKKLPADTAKLSLRYVQGVGVELGELGEVIRTSAGAAAGGAVQLSPEEMKKTIDEVMTKGDAARGEIVYKSQAAACVQCHMIGGVGGPLAPDLRAIGASSPVDYIIDSILIPAKAVKDGYAATAVSTKDGDLIQGIKVREDSKELVLRDNARDEIPIPLTEIKKRMEAGSLMPAGLADSMTRQEFLDLIRFLSELGKPGTYSVPTAPLVRRWRTLDPVPPEFAKPDIQPPVSPDTTGWSALYGNVDGSLAMADLARAAGEGKIAIVRFELDVNEAGPVKLTTNEWKGLQVWSSDGKQVAIRDGAATFNAIKGVQPVTVKIDLSVRGDEPLELEVAEVAGSKARAVPVLGR